MVALEAWGTVSPHCFIFAFLWVETTSYVHVKGLLDVSLLVLSSVVKFLTTNRQNWCSSQVSVHFYYYQHYNKSGSQNFGRLEKLSSSKLFRFLALLHSQQFPSTSTPLSPTEHSSVPFLLWGMASLTTSIPTQTKKIDILFERRSGATSSFRAMIQVILSTKVQLGVVTFFRLEWLEEIVWRCMLRAWTTPSFLSCFPTGNFSISCKFCQWYTDTSASLVPTIQFATNDTSISPQWCRYLCTILPLRGEMEMPVNDFPSCWYRKK